MAVGYRDDGTAGQRAGALVATVVVHILLLLILWEWRTKSDPVAPSAALSIFDVAPPVPDIQPIPPPPIPPPTLPTSHDGGSPDRLRPAHPVPFVAPLRATEMMAEPLPSQALQGEIPLQGLAMAAPPPGGTGTASADGDGGRGRGTGVGSGDGQAGLAKALWIRVPTFEEFEANWPERARRSRTSGRVLLSCVVPRPGPPRRCHVVSEYPRNLGFGAAAIRLSSLFRIQPVTRGTEVQKLPITVPVVFDVPIEIKLPTLAAD